MNGRAPAPPDRRAVGGPRLKVDPISCEGIGLCAHLAPDVVDLDRWGYPILHRGVLRPSGVAQATRAVRGCPRRALWLEEA